MGQPWGYLLLSPFSSPSVLPAGEDTLDCTRPVPHCSPGHVGPSDPGLTSPKARSQKSNVLVEKDLMEDRFVLAQGLRQPEVTVALSQQIPPFHSPVFYLAKVKRSAGSL